MGGGRGGGEGGGKGGGVKAATFRELKALDEFDFSFNPSIRKKQVFDLATCRFIREAKDLLLLGPPGTGKSFLVQAIGYQAIKTGYTVLYRSIFDAVREFLHDEVFAGQEKVLARYLKPDLLIIDDFGMKQLPKRSGECLFEVIMRRYETRSTVMTSNRPLEDWGKLIGDVPSATAISIDSSTTRRWSPLPAQLPATQPSRDGAEGQESRRAGTAACVE